MAYESEKKELRERVKNLVREKFNGVYKMAFDHYDSKPKDGKISSDELVELLKDADVGNWMTRARWADAVIAELDSDKDGGISWSEFEAKLR